MTSEIRIIRSEESVMSEITYHSVADAAAARWLILLSVYVCLFVCILCREAR